VRAETEVRVTLLSERFDPAALWEGEKRRAIADMRDVDDGLMPYLERLNLLPSLYTVQSCRGHVPPDPKAEGGIKRGLIWIRFDSRAGVLYLGAGVAELLSSRNWCEQAGLIWGREHFPVLEVSWRPEAWRAAMESVCEALGASERGVDPPRPRETF